MMPMNVQPKLDAKLRGLVILTYKTGLECIIKEVNVIFLIDTKQVPHNIFCIGHQIRNKVINRLIIILDPFNNQMTQILIIIYEQI